MTVWLDYANIPLASETKIEAEGSALLGFTFESIETEKLKYAVKGDRV